MWTYNKYLLYPVRITKPNLDIANMLVTLIGGYSGELGAALRYLNQANTMPTEGGKALLTDIGTEEMAHVEILANMIKCLTKGANEEDILKSKDLANFIEHKYSFMPPNASGNPLQLIIMHQQGIILLTYMRIWLPRKKLVQYTKILCL